MDLSVNTQENIDFMVNEIVSKLKMVNIGALQLQSLDDDLYEELCEIYEMVMKKNNFSPNEMQALAEELGRLRKNA
ncbi:DUF1128 domain-containing protein [Lederbergia graminis]|uniref:UPF0435 protein ACFPM4_19215 n=1 Tax=Lederbergia graminis TaxID=735518 RepID=A0ABW0LLV2_9BACI